MTRAFKVAVVGASGVVGETLIRVLEERAFPVGELFALASQRSLGKKVRFGGTDVPVDDLELFDFRRAEIGFFCAGVTVSRAHVPRASASDTAATTDGCACPRIIGPQEHTRSTY